MQRNPTNNQTVALGPEKIPLMTFGLSTAQATQRQQEKEALVEDNNGINANTDQIEDIEQIDNDCCPPKHMCWRSRNSHIYQVGALVHIKATSFGALWVKDTFGRKHCSAMVNGEIIMSVGERRWVVRYVGDEDEYT